MLPTPTDSNAMSPADRNRSPSEAVVEAVADAEGADPTDLQPLYDVVDPDALDSLFQLTAGGNPTAGGHVSFTYHGYDVRVDQDGRVTLDGA